MTVEELAEVARVRRMCRSGEAASIRHRAGMTLDEVASAVGVSHVAVHSWENGKKRPGDVSALKYGRVLDAIAKAAGLDVERTLPLFDPPGRKAGAR